MPRIKRKYSILKHLDLTQAALHRKCGCRSWSTEVFAPQVDITDTL